MLKRVFVYRNMMEIGIISFVSKNLNFYQQSFLQLGRNKEHLKNI